MQRQPNSVRRPRPAFTLIELLVVIGLIVVITAIGIFTIPLFYSQQKASSNSSQVVAWLGNTKVRAMKEQRPTGLRFILDPNDPTNTFIREVQYVQTPEDYVGGMGDNTGGRVYQPTTIPANGPYPLDFFNVDFYGGLSDPTDYPVQPGDYLEIAGGQLYQIISVPNSRRLTVSRVPVVPAATYDSQFNLFYTTQWRIIRQPRRVVGEDSLTLSGSVAIDLPQCKNMPVRFVPSTPAQSYYEIIFAPNGGVVGRGTNSSDRIILWVRDSSKATPFENSPVLISIQVRTGFIGTYQVDQTSGDPYSYARDPRASGM